MARARNIKPGLFANEDLAECEPLARILFTGLWCIADRSGRLEDRPKRIRAEILPYDNCDANDLLEQLQKRGFILRYERGGQRFIQVINFDKHQNPHMKEAKSTIPSPFDNDMEACDSDGKTISESVEHSESTMQSHDSHETSHADSLIPDSLIPDSREKQDASEAQAPSPAESRKPKAEKIEFDMVSASWSGISATQRKVWEDAYPAVDLHIELSKAAAWLISNPANRKSNYAAFLTRWFTKAQDSAPARGARPSRHTLASPSIFADLEAKEDGSVAF